MHLVPILYLLFPRHVKGIRTFLARGQNIDVCLVFLGSDFLDVGKPQFYQEVEDQDLGKEVPCNVVSVGPTLWIFACSILILQSLRSTHNRKAT